MNKNLRIKIEGAPATGKTTVAILLMEALRAAGFDGVVFDDDDVANARTPEMQALCLASLSKDTFVEVETLMAPKTSWAEPPLASWSPRQPAAQALVMTMWDGSVRPRGSFTVRDLHDANFVAMVDPEDDGDTGVVSKCRYGIYPTGAVLTHEHLGDIALAHSALVYASDRVFVGAKNRGRHTMFFEDMVDACRVLTTESRRLRLSGLIAQLLP